MRLAVNVPSDTGQPGVNAMSGIDVTVEHLVNGIGVGAVRPTPSLGRQIDVVHQCPSSERVSQRVLLVLESVPPPPLRALVGAGAVHAADAVGGIVESVVAQLQEHQATGEI